MASKKNATRGFHLEVFQRIGMSRDVQNVPKATDIFLSNSKNIYCIQISHIEFFQRSTLKIVCKTMIVKKILYNHKYLESVPKKNTEAFFVQPVHFTC